MPYTITKISHSTMADSQNRAIPAVSITYMVGNHGPFMAIFPALNFTPLVAKAELEKMATHVRELAGA